MKFGIFLGVQISPEESLAQQIEDSAEQVRAARDAGFDLICTGQHFLSAELISEVVEIEKAQVRERRNLQVSQTVDETKNWRSTP